MTSRRITLRENPIRKARQEAGYSLQKFANYCGIHRQALYMNECGAYESILPKIMGKLVELGFTSDELLLDYHNYQINRRNEIAALARASGILVWHLDHLGDASLEQAPIANLREKLGFSSRQGFLKALCVQPAYLYSLEKGTARRLYTQVRDALRDIGLPEHLIDELDERTEEFFEYTKSLRKTARGQKKVTR